MEQESQNRNKKILMICAASKMVIHFRKDLIFKFISEGYSVSVAAFDDDYKKEIIDLGVEFYSLDNDNRTLNPFKLFSLEKKYLNLIKEISPDVVFTFMLKPNIFGVLAANKAGVTNIFSMVEGAGDVFIFNTIKWKLIRAVVCFLYRKSLKCCKKVFFINKDDKKEFIRRRLVKKDNAEVVHGIGVNLEEFEFSSIENFNTFLMTARLLKTKGVLEYCKAAKIVKEKYPEAIFNLVGGEATLTVLDIQDYIQDGTVNYIGEVDDVTPYLKDCSCFVLPSYREGLPMSTMEAEAMGKIIITSDTVGCRDTVVDGYNGYLVPAKDYKKLAEKMTYVLEHPADMLMMGENGRKFAEENFDREKINNRIFKIVTRYGE